jgi:hypothetical protein
MQALKTQEFQIMNNQKSVYGWKVEIPFSIPQHFQSCIGSIQRDLREGWPLLIVETEANMDSKRTNERESFLIGLLSLSCRYKRFLFCLGFSSRFFHRTLFQCLYPHRPASWAGSRAG